MRKQWSRRCACTATVVLLLALLGSAAGAEKTKVKGIIISRTGNELMVKRGDQTTTVVLNDETKTKDNKGLFGARKEYMADTVLIPGLKVNVDGVSDDLGRVVARTITVDGDDLETAQMIQAGLHPTAEQVQANEQAIAANKQNIASNSQQIEANKQQIQQNMSDIQENTDRFSQLHDYEVKDSATVSFAVGSSKIASADQGELQRLAENAKKLNGYIIEVKGFADSSGSAVMNEQLSEDRAAAVVGYLVRQGNVPVWRVVAPGAMGEYQPAATNETKEGRAQNRRVEVKVLVNRGINGSQPGQ